MKTLKIIRDESPQNPFEDHDGYYPIIVEGSGFKKDYSNNDIDNFLTSYLTLNQISKHQSKIFKLIDVSKDDFNWDYPLGEWSKEERAQVLDDLLNEWIVESIENRVSFCEVFNIKHYSGTSQGYSQGDYADIFVCWTPEFEKTTGVTYKKVTEADMENTFKLYGYWAWGDCYGFEVTEQIKCDCCGEIKEKEIGSCWGFFGDDHFKSGLVEHVRHHFEHLSNNEFEELINNQNK